MRSLRSFLFGSFTTGSLGDAGLLVLRVIAGLSLAIAHGFGKVPPRERFVGMIGGFGFPVPDVLAWLSAFAEAAGGLLLAAGLLTRPAALLIVIDLVVALIFAHAGDPFGRRELPLLFASIAFMFMFVGGGRYSIDWLIGRPRR